MAAPSPPIDIKIASRPNSASPHSRAAQFASALQQAGVDGMDIPYQDSRDAAPNTRQDSLGVPRTAARPISTDGARRGSGAGSFMGGMSFGGISMNSWMQDEYVAISETDIV